jgi:predicted RNA polymerase sigma factor
MTTTSPLTRRQFERLAASAHLIIFHRLARRYRDAYLADSVTTDSLTAAWQKWSEDPGFFSNHNLTNWATQRATWRALDDLRRRSKSAALVEEHQGDESEEPAKAPDAPAIAPEQAAEREMRNQLVYATIQGMSAEDRFLLEGMLYDGLTDQAMGAMLFGEGSGTAAALGLRIFRRRQKAMARLRERLVRQGFDENDLLAAQAV